MRTRLFTLQHHQLPLLIGLLLTASKAFAYDTKVDGIYYNCTLNGGATVTYYSYASTENGTAYTGDIVLPESITYKGPGSNVAMVYPVTRIGSSAFYSCNELTSIILPESLKGIYASAFAGCSKLSSITIPDGVTEIGPRAFMECSSLTSVILGKGLTSIGEDAFFQCPLLTSVTVTSTTPPTLETAFGNAANATLYVPAGCKETYETTAYWADFKEVVAIISFADANVKALCVAKWDINGDGELSEDEAAAVTNLYQTFTTKTDITTFDELKYFTGLQTIGQDAFIGCTSLTSVVIPSNVHTLGWRSFNGCRNLNNIVFPEGLKNILAESFENCSSLSSVTIPKTVSTIVSSAFKGCTALSKVIVADLESWCKIGFGLDGNPLVNAHHLYVGNEEVMDLVIPSNITKIQNYAFQGCTGLKTLTIHKDVTNIGFCAFNDCANLERINIEDLSAWCNIDFGSGDDTYSPLYYAHHLYLNGKEITDLVIPDGILSVKYEAFQGCLGLRTLHLPRSLKTIGEYAFAGCDNLTSVTTDVESPIALEGNEFTNRNNITLTVPYGCKAAYEAAEYWKDFNILETAPPQCAKPTITIVDGKLKLTCETEGVTFKTHYSYSSGENEVEGDEVILGGSITYNISVVASKEGLGDSEAATAEVTLSVGKDGDVNRDGTVTVADVTKVIDIIIGKEQ